MATKLSHHFAWLAQEPRNHFTLGDLIFGRHNDLFTFPLGRAGRVLERAVTASAVVLSGVALFTGAPVLGLSALALLQIGKFGGVMAGLGLSSGLDYARQKLEAREKKTNTRAYGENLAAIRKTLQPK
jgi:hypothetical protein